MLKHLARFLHEQEVVYVIFVFGVAEMLAGTVDAFHMGSHVAAVVRSAGLLLLVGLLVSNIRRARSGLRVPLLLEEDPDRQAGRRRLEAFIGGQGLAGEAAVLRRLGHVREGDLVIEVPGQDLRRSQRVTLWRDAWSRAGADWHHLDGRFEHVLLSGQPVIYHVYPHVLLELAFIMGASVGLRRGIVLYHEQAQRIHAAVDVADDPRRVVAAPPPGFAPPALEPDPVPAKAHDKLILYFFITDRHQVSFTSHPDHEAADSVALVYRQALPGCADWLPYVQALWTAADPLMAPYDEVEVCLSMPSVVAFALGMALSRSTKVSVCRWTGMRYVRVFSLRDIDRRLIFG